MKFHILSIACLVVSIQLTNLAQVFEAGRPPIHGLALESYVLDFKTKSDQVTTPVRITTTDFTIEVWVKTTELAAENQIISQYIAGDSGRTIFGIRNSTPALFIAKWVSGNQVDLLDKWVHLAATRNGKNCAIYVNGTLNSAFELNDNPLSASDLIIGGISSKNAGFRGQISDVRVWNLARTQQQIGDAMLKRLKGTESGLLYYWKLDEGSGIYAYNTTAATAIGTIAGAKWLAETLPFIAESIEGSWISTLGGNWSNHSNWLNSDVPAGVTSKAFFTNPPPAAITINNDVAGLKLWDLTIDSGESLTFTGNSITLTNEIAGSTIKSINGAHLFDLPLTMTTPGLKVVTDIDSSLSVDKPLAGQGVLNINVGESGGIISFNGANTFEGALSLNSGTLVVDDLNSGGTVGPLGKSTAAPSNLILGAGTLKYTGGATATDRGYTVQAPIAPVRAAIFHTDSDVTFGGQILADSGAFIKTGAGTLYYTYPGLNKYMAHAGGAVGNLLEFDSSGNSPLNGFSGFTIAEGRVVLGVPDQINVFSNVVEIGVYTTTNANSEHSAEMVINGGTFICSANVLIGRNNGTTITAPDGTTSSLTINDGDVSLRLIACGSQGVGLTNFNSRSKCVINGGDIKVSNLINIGERIGSKCELNVSGGSLSVTGTGNSIVIGAGTGEGTFNLSGGCVTCANNVVLGLNAGIESKGTINFNGGTLIAANIVKGSGSGAWINFNGGVFSPTMPEAFSGFNAVKVARGGAIFDTSLSDSYTIEQKLLHAEELGNGVDGGLIKLGTGELIFAVTGSDFTGPTLVSGGVLRVTGKLPSATAVQIVAGAELIVGGTTPNNQTIQSLIVAGEAILGFTLALDGSALNRITVSDALELSEARVALYQADTVMPFTLNGVYTLIEYSGTTPDVSAMVCANPVPGKSYTFSAANGEVNVTIANDSGGTPVWSVDDNGAWSNGANWSLPQSGVAGSLARLDDAIDAPRTITTAGEHVGALYFNSLNPYSLTGSGLVLDNGGNSAQLSVESGAHTVEAPLELASDTLITLSAQSLITLNSTTGSGKVLRANGYGALALAAPLTLQALELALPTLYLLNSIDLTTPLTLEQSIEISPAQATHAEISSAITGGGDLIKSGSSTLELSGSSSYSGATILKGGTLSVTTLANGSAASNIGASSATPENLVLGPATLLHRGINNISNRGYTLDAGSNPVRAAVIHVEDHLTFGGEVKAVSGGLLKIGPGTLAYTYPGLNTISAHQSSNVNTPHDTDEYGNGPTVGFAGLSVADGTVVMGAPGQTNRITGRLLVGVQTTTLPNMETSGELIVNDGVVECTANLGVSWHNGTAITAGSEGTRSRLTINGGLIKAISCSLGMNNLNLPYYNARPTLTINDGTLELGGSLVLSEAAGAYSVARLNGGLLNVLGSTGGHSIRIGGSGEALLSMSGRSEVTATADVVLAEKAGAPCAGTLHLGGGRLQAPNIVKGVGNTATLIFDGGTFVPSALSKTLTGLDYAYVSTNGMVIDTTKFAYTIAQDLLHDPLLYPLPDGGLLKIGIHPLSLTATGNTFNGSVNVVEGLLCAQLGATNNLIVAEGAAFDSLGQATQIGDLRGSGLLTNGSLVVHGCLNPGTNNAPIGATMTVENLTLAKGSMIACDWVTNQLGQATSDCTTVLDTLMIDGAGLFDFGRSEGDPVPIPLTLTIFNCEKVAGTFAGWKATNTGLPAGITVVASVEIENGVVKVTLRYGGTMLMLM